ncbi:hypothetical protein F66182_4492 [Fusarium sp. NRRL 66182]|nr:hypothetical protein F66182_4492 [Fusarium sp. NRRL 66182]
MSKLPPTTRTLVAPKKCLPAEYEMMEQPMPTITKPNDVLVRMKAVAINTGDTQFASGAFDILHKGVSYPYPIGKEGSGVVVAVGSFVTEFQAGDAVYGVEIEKPIFARPHPAWSSEYTVTEPKFLHRKPEHLSFEEAAALPAMTATAYQVIKRGLQLQGRESLAGQTVYIPAALSASGSTIIQVARNYFGAGNIISTVSTPKMELVEENLPGMVNQLYDYKTQDVVKSVGRGTVDFALNTQFSTLDECISLLKPQTGILMSIASLPRSEDMLEMMGAAVFPRWVGWLLDFAQLWYTWKLRGTEIKYEFVSGDPGVRRDMEIVGEMIAQAKVRGVLTRVEMDDLEEVRRACARVCSSKGGLGKLVLAFSEEGN